MIGALAEQINKIGSSKAEMVLGLLGVNNSAIWNSRLSYWINDDNHANASTFYNQALNPVYTFSARGLGPLKEVWTVYSNGTSATPSIVQTINAREI